MMALIKKKCWLSLKFFTNLSDVTQSQEILNILRNVPHHDV